MEVSCRCTKSPCSPLTAARVSAFGALLLLTSGCCTDPVTGGSYFCWGDVTDDEEVTMGHEYAPSFIAESGGVYPDEKLQTFLRRIVVDRMARRSQRPDLPWEFHVLNTSEVNAFALPGGQVFITRGLLVRLETEAQFAQLMGHEIGHVTHRHSVRGQNRGVLFGVLLGAVRFIEDTVFDPDEVHLVSGTAAAIGQVAFLRFSRSQELEADRRGVDYAVMTSYEPREARKTFEMFLRLKEEAGQGESAIGGLLSSHPLDSTRIVELDEYIEDEYAYLPANLLRSRPAWNKHLVSIRAAHEVYARRERALELVESFGETRVASILDEAEQLLVSCARQLPDHAPMHVSLAMVDLARADLVAAARHLDRAIELDGDSFDAHLLRGMTRARADLGRAAIADLTRAHELHPLSPVPCFLIGGVHEEAGRYGDAAEWYRRSLELSPKSTEMRRASRQRLDRVEL